MPERDRHDPGHGVPGYLSADADEEMGQYVRHRLPQEGAPMHPERYAELHAEADEHRRRFIAKAGPPPLPRPD